MALIHTRVRAILPWALSAACACFGGWSVRQSATAENRADSLATRVAALQGSLDEAEVLTFELQREREDNQRNLDNLFAGKEDLRRMYDKATADSKEIRDREVEVRRQSRLTEQALQGEQAARTEEQKQRVLVEEQKDSIAAEQRLKESANQRLRASKVAQNSLALKGDARLRGLMAVEALRSMEAGGGDGNNEEVVRALQGALDELERTAPVGVQRLGAGARFLHMEGSELLVLGNDGMLLRVDPVTWQKRTAADLSKRTGPGGRAFLSDGYLLTTNADRRIAIHSPEGTLIAAQERTAHEEDITAMAAFADGKGLVSGDRNGLLVVWAVEGDRLRVVNEHTIGGVVRTLVFEPGSGKILAVNGTERLSIIGKDGSNNAVSLSDADRANCAAVGQSGEVLVGTHQGAVFSVRLGEREVRRIHNGRGTRVETLACMPGTRGKVAMVDALHHLSVFDAREPGTSAYQVRLDGVPNVLAFGSADVIYLSYEDKTVRRVFVNSRSLADRVCALSDRSWTVEEWNKHIGEGAPMPTCARTP